jgi:hypothetical protein
MNGPHFVREHFRVCNLWKPKCWIAATLVLAQSAYAQGPKVMDGNPVLSKLNREAQHLGSGYLRSSEEIIDNIPRDQSKRVPVQLVTGGANAIIAACSGECDHIEIALYDYKRTGRIFVEWSPWRRV